MVELQPGTAVSALVTVVLGRAAERSILYDAWPRPCTADAFIQPSVGTVLRF